ncbi:MAG TPA: ABC transporter substrate-binding protein [Bacilli bacterium]
MNIGKLTKSLLILTLAFSFALAGCANGGKEKKTVKIGYLPITHAVPLYFENDAAKEGKLAFNLELIKFGSWQDLSNALNAGRVDGASLPILLAMRAKEQGIDLKAVALGHRDGNVLMVANDIQSVADLRGKTYAIPSKFSTHNILLYLMLKKAGLPYSDINPVEMAPASMPASLATGKVSGYVVAEPFGALGVHMGKGKVIYQDKDVWPNSIDCALVLRGDFLAESPDTAQQFVTEYVKAGEAAEKKDEETDKVAQSYMKVDKDVLNLSLKWISYGDLRVNEDSYDELRQYVIEMGLSDNPPAYADFVDNSLYDNALKK